MAVLAGQKYEDNEVILNDDSTASCGNQWVQRYFSRDNKYVGMIIPILFFHTVWWTLAWRYSLLDLFRTRWQMPVTMTVGATVAGKAFVEERPDSKCWKFRNDQ